MKEIIVILLIIFASLAFGADYGDGGELQNLMVPGAKIKLPYKHTKTVKGVGKVDASLKAGPAIDEMTLKIWASCYDKNGKLTKPELIGNQPLFICEYSSEVYEPQGHVVTFQYRKSLDGVSDISRCNSEPLKASVELEVFCATKMSGRR